VIIGSCTRELVRECLTDVLPAQAGIEMCLQHGLPSEACGNDGNQDVPGVEQPLERFIPEMKRDDEERETALPRRVSRAIVMDAARHV